LSPEELAERMQKMRVKNAELEARRRRTDEDERIHFEQERVRLGQERAVRVKREGDRRIQSEIEFVSLEAGGS
jgi:hypothetical protein